jgi:hypothetical protein
LERVSYYLHGNLLGWLKNRNIVLQRNSTEMTVGAQRARIRAAKERGVEMRVLLVLGWLAFWSLAGQEAKPASSDGWSRKTFDVKYIDPEQVRRVFAGQSYVMEANRELKVLTVCGSPAFLKEVEDTIKRLDVAPPSPPNAQVTVYLLATAAQAPAGKALPADLKAVTKDVPEKLADMQMFRVRAGQSGETSSPEAAAAPAVSLVRVRVDSASVSPSAKGDIVSLNGLKVWINIPPSDPAAIPSKTPKNDPDVSADIDLAPNEAVVVAKLGVDKPIAVVVRVGVAR